MDWLPEHKSVSAIGRYRMEGTFDYATDRITLTGVEWDEQGGLDTMMTFEGVYDPDTRTMSGTCEALDGSCTGEWLLVQHLLP